MTQLQQRILELLKLFVGICEKYQLRYFLVCGSALGAAKYQGFIPWDDDLDVALPREDYRRFLEVAQKELPQWCFVQNYRTDPQFPHVYTKLRDSRTTLLEAGVAHLHMNHGVFLDVFCLDGYPRDENQQRELFHKKKLLTWKQVCGLRGGGNWKVRIRNPVFRILGYHKRTARTLEKMDRLIGQYSPEEAEIWCMHGNWQGELDYVPSCYYGAGTLGVFEGIPVVLPEKYDDYLTRKYGDWHSAPPPEMQCSHHTFLALDLAHSYTEYNQKGRMISDEGV